MSWSFSVTKKEDGTLEAVSSGSVNNIPTSISVSGHSDDAYASLGVLAYEQDLGSLSVNGTFTKPRPAPPVEVAAPVNEPQSPQSTVYQSTVSRSDSA